MPDEYAIAIHSLLRLYGYHGSDLEGAIISSVVPPLSASLKQAITRIKPVRILTVGPGIKTGLHNKPPNPFCDLHASAEYVPFFPCHPSPSYTR